MSIEKNTVVSIEYEVKDALSGEMIDSNKGGDALEFLMGGGHIVSGLEEAIALMSEGESRQLVVSSDKAYGAYDENALEEIEKEQFAGVDLREGMTLYGQAENGKTVQVTVKSIGDETVTIDHNHPLAGKNLSFDVKVVKTRKATDEEIASGVLEGYDSCCGEHDDYEEHGGCSCHCH
ncbi:MAG: peptidylprolyl isomerase [Helicobacteraceae bacterium]|jgi:FKBP-type peptidyl-prolyl cis-trans isomerase SlyD|nr:peptidylprolyl isomerase [Helicobacteraceae bacterium]